MDSSGFSTYSKNSWGSGFDSSSFYGSSPESKFSSTSSNTGDFGDTPISGFSDFTSGSSFDFKGINKQIGKSSTVSTSFSDTSTTDDSFLASSSSSTPEASSNRAYRMYLPVYNYQVEEKSGVYQKKLPRKESPVSQGSKHQDMYQPERVAKAFGKDTRKMPLANAVKIEHRGEKPKPGEIIVAQCEHQGNPNDVHECEVSKVIYVYIRGEKGDPGIGIQGNPGRDGRDGKDGRGHKGVPGSSAPCPLSHYYLTGDSTKGRKYIDELRDLPPIVSEANSGSHVKLYPGHYRSLNVAPGVTYSGRGRVVVDDLDTRKTIGSDVPANVEGVTFNRSNVGGNTEFNRCTFNDIVRLIDEENVNFDKCSLKGVEIHEPKSRNRSSRIGLTNNDFDSTYAPIVSYGNGKMVPRYLDVRNNRFNLGGNKDKMLTGSRFDGTLDDVHMTGNTFSVPDNSKGLVVSEFGGTSGGRVTGNAVVGSVPENLIWANNTGKGRVEAYGNYPDNNISGNGVRVLRDSARLNKGDKKVFIDSSTPINVTLPEYSAGHSVKIKGKYGNIDHRIHPMEGENIEGGLNAYPLIGTKSVKFYPHGGTWNRM